MFGQNKSFGSSSFGGGSSGSGLFGQNNQNNQNKGLFGQPANNSGTTGLFGAAQNKPAGSIFGAASNTSSIFGSPQQPQNNQSSLFGGGQNNANRSIFGSTSSAAPASSSLFGNNANNTGTSSIFGSNNNAPSGGGLFGASTVSGTTVKFEPPISSDTMMRNGTTQTISTKHMCISAMSKYDGKSIEELRVEDYIANRKAPGTGTTSTGGGLFGASNTTNQAGSSGLFGSSNAQQKTSLFGGASTSSPFGGNTSTANTGSSLFGNNNANTSAASGSLFGAKPAGSSLFGSTATTGASTFGQTTGSSLFGNQQPQTNTGGSLFGNTQNQNQSGSLFGNTGTTGTGLFGQAQQQPQQQSSGFSFGGAPAATNAFGQPAAANTGGSLFGNTSTANTGSSLFGAKPATSTGFTFGATQPTTTNAFGSTNTGGGLFGNNAAKPGGLFGNTTNTGTGGGLFGSQPQASSGGLFGSNTQATQPLNTGFGNLAQPQIVMQQQVAPVPVIGVTADVLQMQANMKSLKSQLTNAPYGDSPLLKYNANPEIDGKSSPASTQRQLRFLAAKKGALSSSSDAQDSSFIIPPISKVMSDLSPAVTRSADVTKDLNYTSKEAPPSLARGLRNSTFNPNMSLTNRSVHESSALDKTIDSALDASMNGTSNRLGVRGSVRRSNLKQLDMSLLADSSRVGRESRVADPDALPRISESERRQDVVTSTPAVDPVQAVIQRHNDRNRDPPSLNLDTTCDEHTGLEPVSAATSSAASVVSTPSEETVNVNSAAGVKLTKPDYFSLPTINEMKNMIKNGRVVLEDGLTVGRSSYGSVYWPGRVELKDVALDEIVVFRHREVTVYPNEEEKAPEGQELNRPAEVTLERDGTLIRRPRKKCEMS